MTSQEKLDLFAEWLVANGHDERFLNTLKVLDHMYVLDTSVYGLIPSSFVNTGQPRFVIDAVWREYFKRHVKEFSMAFADD